MRGLSKKSMLHVTLQRHKTRHKIFKNFVIAVYSQIFFGQIINLIAFLLGFLFNQKKVLFLDISFSLC